MQKHLNLFYILIHILMIVTISDGLSSTNNLDVLDELIRTRIETAGYPPIITIGSEVIYAAYTLPKFYENRAYKPAWSGDKGPLKLVTDLIESIEKADEEGLHPEDYHLGKIRKVLGEILQNRKLTRSFNPRRLTDLDFLCTDAFLIYGSHLLAGRLNPETIDPEWVANRREMNMAEILETAIGQKQIQQSLESLLPPQHGYQKLREALAKYQDILVSGGWNTIPDGPELKAGDYGKRVVALRHRIRLSHDYFEEVDLIDSLFDIYLEQAVSAFQNRYGLEPDGIVGASTLAELNIPVEERIRQIEINMERWRWLPQDLGKKHILVNIANFELDVVENESTVMIMKVVTGRTYRRTPVFSDQITYLVLNPYWNIPDGIVFKDILPAVQKDVNYLTQKNIRVFQGWDADTKEIDPYSVDWSTISSRNCVYRFRQEPGSNNALGRIKFMFPNKFNIYLHDTPSKELFEKTERTFSSGCIRLENPIDLAEYVLKGDPRWNRKKIVEAIQSGTEQTISLPESIPIHILYWTAWADEMGAVYFRKDVYERDKRLYEALQNKPPTLNTVKQ